MSVDHFLQAMEAAGIVPMRRLELADGELARFRVTGDKPGSANGWAVYHDHPYAAGAFGSWRTGERHTWHDIDPALARLTLAQRSEFAALAAARRLAHDQALHGLHSSARDKAARLWATAKPATDAHAYLRAKDVHAYGIRQLRDMLVLPVRDGDGQLHTLQFIGPDGSKRFLTGGRIAGHYYSIGKPRRRLLLGEGYATCATLHEATGEAVAVCFNCGNMEAVARELRMKFPRMVMVLCADDDRNTPGNPGLTHAKAAAKAVGGFLALPNRGAGTS